MGIDWQTLTDGQLEEVLRQRAAEWEAELAVTQIVSGAWEAKFTRPGPGFHGTVGEASERRLALAALLVADDMNRAEGHRIG